MRPKTGCHTLFNSFTVEKVGVQSHRSTLTQPNMSPNIQAVSLSPTHTFSKIPQPQIHLLANLGVKGDAHCGPLVRHRYLRRRNPQQPNLMQVHLIDTSLLVTLTTLGFHLHPGNFGENILTSGIDLLSLPTSTRLHLGPTAVVEVTGLRTPCIQMDRLQPGLMAASFHLAPAGKKLPRAGIMATVLTSGTVTPGDPVYLELPPPPHIPLKPI